MKEQKTTKWSNFNPLCLARHVLRNLWMTVLAGAHLRYGGLSAADARVQAEL